MRSLLKKDWMLYRIFFIVILGMMLWGALSALLTFGPVSPTLFTIPFLWLAPVSMTLFEFKNDSDVLINSLPVTRRQVVLSKYVILSLFSVVSAAILAVIHILLQSVLSVEFFPPPIVALILTYAGIGAFLSIYLPLYFLAGPRFMLFASLAMFFAGFIGLSKISPHAMDVLSYLLDLWQQYTVLQWSFGLFTVTTLLLLLSWWTATRIYETKNF